MTWAVDTSTQGTYGTSNPNTLSHTCSASTKLLVLAIFVNGTTARTGGAPTYNGTPMTDSGQGFVFLSGGEAGVEVWYLIEPDTGSSYTVSVPNTGAVNCDLSVTSFEATNNAAFDNSNSASADSGTWSVSVTVSNNNCLMFGAVGSGERDTPTAGTNYTLIHTYDAGNQVWGSEYDLDAGSSGSITVDFTPARADDWGLIGIGFYETTTATVTGAAALTGTGSLSAIGKGIASSAAALSGTGTITNVPAYAITSSAGALSGTGTLSAIGFRLITGVAALSGTGTLSAIGARVALGVAALSGTGTLSAAGYIVFPSEVTIQNNQGRLSFADSAQAYARAISTMADQSNAELTAKFTFGDLVSEGLLRFHLRGSGDWADWQTPTTAYEVEIANTGDWKVYRIQSGSRTQIGTTQTWTSTTEQHSIKFQVVGTDIRAKVWRTIDSEPGWQKDIDDSTSGFTTAGTLQLGYFRVAGSHYVDLDDVSVQSPESVEFGVAALTGTGTLSTSGLGIAYGTAAISGTGTLTAKYAHIPLTDLIYWLDFSDQTAIWKTSTERIGADNDTIYEIKDKSGNNYGATQATEGLRPTWKTNIQNGLAMSLWNPATTTNMRGPYGDMSSVLPTNTGTAFVVLIQDGTNANNTVINTTIASVAGDNQITIHATYSNNLYFDMGDYAGGGRIYGAQPSGWDDVAHIYSAYRSGSSGEISVDGAPIVLTVDTYTDDFEPGRDVGYLYTIGANFPGNQINFKGYIGEIIFYKTKLSAAEILQVQRYLTDKWSVTLIQTSAASLSGTGTLSATGSAIVSGAASLTGTGTLTSSGTGIASSAATLTGTGTLTGIPLVISFGVTSLTGTGTLSAIGTFFSVQQTSAALTGTGTLSAIGYAIASSAGTMSGTGTLTGVPFVLSFGVSALTGTGTLSAIGSAAGIEQSAATLSGTGTLSAIGEATAFGVTALSGTGTLSSASYAITSSAGALSGTGTLSAIATTLGLKTGVVSMSGTGTLSAIPQVFAIATASLTGTGTLTTAAYQISINNTASLSGTGTMSVIGSVGGIIQGVATLDGTGTLSAIPFVVSYAVATMSGTGTLVSSSLIIVPVSVTMSGTGTLSATGYALALGVVAMTGTGTLSAIGSGIGIETGVASLTGVGTLTADYRLWPFTDDFTFSDDSVWDVSKWEVTEV